jgi:transposase
VIKVGTLAKVRRLFFREQVPVKEIQRRTGLSRNTIRKWLKEPEMIEPKYPARQMPTKLDAHAQVLSNWLSTDLHRGKRDRRTVKMMFDDLVQQGYAGGYGRVAAFARDWREEQLGRPKRAAYVPMKFELGEAFQFDWSTEYLWVEGLRRRLEVSHTKLCASRAFFMVAYPTQSHEMLFDAHARSFAAFGGVPRRGIYDNMKTAVDKVGRGKARVINARFEAMTGHYLFEPEFCNVASGWEKGIVEKNVRDRRSSIWYKATQQRWASLDELNAWVANECKQSWQDLNHPEWPALKVADVLQDEQTRLMPMPRPFDGYVEVLARVSSTSLIHLQRNRYSVPTEHAHSVVGLRLYPDRVNVVADNAVVATHGRSFERNQTFYDWRHYVSLIERKPGALRNGAPFETLPEPLKRLQTILLRHAGGDRVMAQVLAAVPVHGLESVLVAAELALEAGKPSGEHVLNILSRLKAQDGTLEMAAPDERLKLRVEPRADVDRYDRLRSVLAMDEEDEQ